ncbi:hypothetical protein RMATCC62417_01218 [Rhizopus microsporus]|nr:hypothetical protein RMATCC62417_01218 [Rhizopus microsporus]
MVTFIKGLFPVVSRVTRVPAVRYQLSPLRALTLSIPRLSSGEVDSDLAHQLHEEIQFEESDKNEPPAFVKEFLDANIFQIEDKEGSDKVALKRSFGNEKVSVIFSISDINKIVEEEKGEVIPEEDEYVELKKPEDESFPDGYFHIQGIRYFRKGEIDHHDIFRHDIGEQRQDLYMGPLFEELSQDLQATFTGFLEERGINAALATFLPDYIDYKEQKEYVRWLKDVNEFISK